MTITHLYKGDYKTACSIDGCNSFSHGLLIAESEDDGWINYVRVCICERNKKHREEQRWSKKNES